MALPAVSELERWPLLHRLVRVLERRGWMVLHVIRYESKGRVAIAVYFVPPREES